MCEGVDVIIMIVIVARETHSSKVGGGNLKLVDLETGTNRGDVKFLILNATLQLITLNINLLCTINNTKKSAFVDTI